jgi:hypothetical protein
LHFIRKQKGKESRLLPASVINKETRETYNKYKGTDLFEGLVLRVKKVNKTAPRTQCASRKNKRVSSFLCFLGVSWMREDFLGLS